MDSVAYQQWLQTQARQAAGSAPGGATPWKRAAYARLPAPRPAAGARGGYGTPPGTVSQSRYGQAMQQPPLQQSQYDSLRPGLNGLHGQGPPQQQGLPRGYYADDYDPQSGAPQRQWSNGSGGQVRGILRASSYNQMPSAHPSWGSNASGDQGWSNGQGQQLQQQRMAMANGRGPPIGPQGAYPGGPGGQPGMQQMQRSASTMRGNSFGPPGPSDGGWGQPYQRQQQQQQWLSRDDVGGPHQHEAQYPPNRRSTYGPAGHMDRTMSMPAYSM